MTEGEAAGRRPGATSAPARFAIVTAAPPIARLALAAVLPLGDDEGYY